MDNLKNLKSIKKNFNCILLIDDDPIANYLHLKILNDLNIAKRIDIVTNGEEALNYINKVCHPEIIFLDINMPVMNGIEFLKEYNKIIPLPESSICVLTSSEHLHDIANAEELGINFYLNKPLCEEKLQLVLI
ncbi:MAG: response regulator [Bacteroidota bacterium]|nr:response regulator [Bacteroidota bacterium]